MQVCGRAGHFGRECHRGHRDTGRAAQRDAHHDTLGTDIEVRKDAHTLGGIKHRSDQTGRVREGRRGEHGLRPRRRYPPIRNARLPVELGGGDAD